MPTPWEHLLRLIAAGEAVEAEVANRVPQQLGLRTQYLYDRLQAIAAGEALFRHDVRLEADALVGDVVYFNAAANEYRRAVAGLDYDSVNGWWTISESSYVVGMVYRKTSNTTGHILTAGFPGSFSLESTIGSTYTQAGAYYLSMTDPGKLTIQQPPVGVFVLYNCDGMRFHFGPTPRDVLEDHIHYRFDLYAQPAGDHNCVEYGSGDCHKVLNADASRPGWLPADHALFAGAAPAGAKFGYNLAQHPELERIWPPLPTDGVYIEQNGRGLPLEEPCPVVTVDANGIWWYADCYGAAPWAPDHPGCVAESSPSSSSSSSPGAECIYETPVEYLPGHTEYGLDEKRLRLWFTKMVTKTDQTVVTRLEPCGDTEPVRVLDCDGEPASTGRLCLSFDWNKLAVVEPSAGYKVVKGFSAAQILRGPAVTGVKPGLKASIQGVGEEGVDWALDGDGTYRGDLQVGLEALTDLTEGGIELIALDSVRKDYDDTQKRLYLHFPHGMESSIRGRIELSRTSLTGSSTPDKLNLYIWVWFVSRQPPGVVPQLVATYRRYPRPSGVATLPAAGDEKNIDAGGLWTPGITFTAAGQYAEKETPALEAYVGDTVDFTLGWAGVLPAGLTGGFGILRLGFRIALA